MADLLLQRLLWSEARSKEEKPLADELQTSTQQLLDKLEAISGSIVDLPELASAVSEMREVAATARSTANRLVEVEAQSQSDDLVNSLLALRLAGLAEEDELKKRALKNRKEIGRLSAQSIAGRMFTAPTKRE